ncbi:MAG: Lsr2 family protein [Corynebacteriales bacterium]|nr:Lsr2 family protein [Mycobacteriales bacterium]
MARVEQIILVDDLDGGAADETVSFGIDGRSFEIDLSAKNAQKLRDALAPYIKVAHKAAKTRAPRGTNRARTSAPVDREQNQAIRAWAKKKGYQVSGRGRIPAEVVEKFHAANK